MLSQPSITRDQFIRSIPRDGIQLEIGPFSSPALTGPNVRYADILSAEEIRAEAIRLGKDTSRVPHTIHYKSDLGQIDDHFDAVYSSHCIEHTSDAVRHLRNVSRVLSKDGKYFLVIPDKRYCFDHFKETSTIGGLIDAYENGNSDYSLKLWVDRTWIGTHADAKRHWRGDHGAPNKTNLAQKIKAAITEYKNGYRFPTGTHVWCFTPDSFSEIISLLRELDYIDLRVLDIYPTRPNTLEFYAVLGR